MGKWLIVESDLKFAAPFCSYLVNLFLVPNPTDLVPVEVDAEESVVGADGDAVSVDEAGRQGVLDHGDGVVEHLAAPEHRLVRQLVLLQDPDGDVMMVR